MARIRSIKPEFFSSYSTAKLSLPARFLMIGLMTEADDYGILIDSPKKIAGAVFPHDSRITAARVDLLLTEMVDAGSIRRYEVRGGSYIMFPKWDDHQRISHKGQPRLPLPSGKPPETQGKDSGDAPF